MTLAVLLGGVTPGPESSRRVSAQGMVPVWRATGSLNKPRPGHTATLLRNGKVLVVGGYDSVKRESLSSAELYDPFTEMWTYTGSLNAPRRGHIATSLPNGKVLVLGGTATGAISPEIYDPTAGVWSSTGDGNNIRRFQTATLLPDGRILVGSVDTHGPGFRSVQIFDPASGRWSETGSMSSLVYAHSATLLPNGKVLVAGGRENASGATSLGAELYDPIARTWSPTGNPTHYGYAATLLPNGKVLANNSYSAELYEPKTGTWTETGGIKFLPGDGDAHTATLLADGKVLAVGFHNYDVGYMAQTPSYDPGTGIWSDAGVLVAPRTGHTATLLPNGRVLVAGGNYYDYPLGVSELFDPGLLNAATLVTVSATDFSLMGLTGEAIVSSFGAGLATASQAATNIPLPTSLAGTSVSVRDSADIERLARLVFVSPNQVNYEIPAGTAVGLATVTITSSHGKVSTGTALINKVAPSMFSANGDGVGVAAALVLRVSVDGSQSYEPIAQFDVAQNRLVPRPLDLGPPTDQVFLILFGTGIRHRSSLSSVIAAIGETYADVSFAGAHPEFAGLDQVNVLVPRSLAGKGELNVLLTVEAQISNPVRIHIK